MLHSVLTKVVRPAMQMWSAIAPLVVLEMVVVVKLTSARGAADHQAELNALLDIFLPADLAKLSAVVSSAAKMVAQDGMGCFHTALIEADDMLSMSANLLPACLVLVGTGNDAQSVCGSSNLGDGDVDEELGWGLG